MRHHVLAAKNIRAELQQKFRGVKFSVRSKGYAGGDHVFVRWAGGPTKGEVEPVVRKYKQGVFDGMTDSYVPDSDPQRTAFREIRGSTKYVMLQRRPTL